MTTIQIKPQPGELPIKCTDIMDRLGIKSTLMSAMKRKLGISNARYGFLSMFVELRRQLPTFSETEIYPKKGRPQRHENPQPQAAGIPRERSSKRARRIASLSAQGHFVEPTTSKH